MFGKVKTFIKRHPAISVYLFLCTIFAVMRMFGLPKVMVDLDVFVSVAMLGTAFAAGVVVTFKYRLQINQFCNKHFEKWLKKFGIDTRINHLSYLLDEIELKRLVSSIKNSRKFKLVKWEKHVRARIADKFCNVSYGAMELPSTELAAMIAYSLVDGTSCVQNMEVICDCILDLLLNPRKFNVIKKYGDEEFELDIDPNYTVWGKKVELSERNLILLRQDIISELLNFAVIPLNEHRMYLMAEQFENAVSYRGAFKS